MRLVTTYVTEMQFLTSKWNSFPIESVKRLRKISTQKTRNYILLATKKRE